VLAAAARTATPVVVPRPGERIDVLAPPPVEDWWSVVGSAPHEGHGESGRGVGTSVLARTLSRLVSLLPE
jgi:hypothetical protein